MLQLPKLARRVRFPSPAPDFQKLQTVGLELFSCSELYDREGESDQNKSDSDEFRRGAFFLQDDDAERHADGQTQLAEDLHVGDIRHEIHRIEHENVSDGNDDTCDKRAPLALRDDFAGIGAEGRREGDDRPKNRREDDATDGIDCHGADVRLNLRDEFSDNLLRLIVKDCVSCCSAGD